MFICTSFLSSGKDEGHEVNEHEFDLKTLKKNGILLSDLFKGLEGKNLRLKKNGAIRFDAAYVPQDSQAAKKPFNLPIAEVQRQVEHAQAVLQKVKDNQAFTTALNGKSIQLPIGIKKTVGNKEVIVCLDSIVFTPTYGYAVMYAIVEDTKNNKRLSFRGTDIRFTKEGGFTGDGRLELLQTYDLEFGQSTKISFLVDKTHENYLVFDCDGFKKLHIDADVYFSKDLFLLENQDGTINPIGQVTTSFNTDIQSLDNFIIQLFNIPKFQLKGLEGISFQVQTFAFDYSSTDNPSYLTFPSGYSSPDFTSDNNSMWEGFYIRNLQITLPEEFKLKKNTSQRISFEIENAIIDKLGFTGKASVSNLLTLSDGDMSGWDYSLDYLSVEVIKNTPSSVAFNGKVVVPITKETEYFTYQGSIQPNHQYNFAVSLDNKVSFPLWGGATVSILSGTGLDIIVVDKKFKPSAHINAEVSLVSEVNGKEGDNNTSNRNNILSVGKVSITNLIVKTDAPHLSLGPGGAVSLGMTKSKFAILPITLTRIGLVADTRGHIGLQIGLDINILGESDPGTNSIGGVITIFAQEVNNKWKYYKTFINEIDLNIKISNITLAGKVLFFRDDPYYGSGFGGSIDIKVETGGNNIEGECAVLFGKKTDTGNDDDMYRYWYADALGKGFRVPLYPPVIYLNGFGLGAYYRMLPITQGATYAATPIMVSHTGVGYTPSGKAGLGLKAMIGIEGPTKSVFNGEVGFEISFLKGGGLEMILLTGYIQVLDIKLPGKVVDFAQKLKVFQDKTKNLTAQQRKASPVNKSELKNAMNATPGGAVMVSWLMEYNRSTNEIIANFDTYINVFEVVKGNSDPADPFLAGSVNLYIKTKSDIAKWWLYAGIPQHMISVSIVDIVSAGTYFMIGTQIHPPVPMENGHRNSFSSDVYEGASIGKGFGFGARLSVGAKVGVGIYAVVEGGAGVDIFLLNDHVYCPKINKYRGMKDWYAMGDAYAYVKAGVGVDICIGYPEPTCKCCGSRFCPKLCCWVWHKSCWRNEWCGMLGLGAEFAGVRPTHVKFYVPNPIKNFTISIGKTCN